MFDQFFWAEKAAWLGLGPDPVPRSVLSPCLTEYDAATSQSHGNDETEAHRAARIKSMITSRYVVSPWVAPVCSLCCESCSTHAVRCETGTHPVVFKLWKPLPCV